MNLKQNKLVRIIVTVLLAAGLIAAGYFARGYYDTKQQKDTANIASVFVKDIVSGKTSQAYSLTSKDLKAKQSKDDFAKTVESLKADKPTYDSLQYTKDGDTYFYSIRVLNLPKTSTGSTSGVFLVALTKEGRSWKIASLNVN